MFLLYNVINCRQILNLVTLIFILTVKLWKLTNKNKKWLLLQHYLEFIVSCTICFLEKWLNFIFLNNLSMVTFYAKKQKKHKETQKYSWKEISTSIQQSIRLIFILNDSKGHRFCIYTLYIQRFIVAAKFQKQEASFQPCSCGGRVYWGLRPHYTPPPPH